MVNPKSKSHFLLPNAKLVFTISVTDNSGLKANIIEKKDIGTITYIKGKAHNIAAKIEIPTEANDNFNILRI